METFMSDSTQGRKLSPRDKCDEARELQRRIDRTLDYADSLLRLPDLNADLQVVLRAIFGSLTTPISHEV
jgi:hypothetical protein